MWTYERPGDHIHLLFIVSLYCLWAYSGVEMTDEWNEFRQYVSELQFEKLDAEIRGIPFERQEILDALEEWAHTVEMENDESTDISDELKNMIRKKVHSLYENDESSV